MSDFQRKLFQKKLKEAESALGFDFSEEVEGEENLRNTPPKHITIKQNVPKKEE